MSRSERLCLLLADLSGYTAYVTASEPEHAPAMAGDLVESVIRQLRPAFRLEKLEGDAAFLVAPLERLDGQQLLDAIDAAYGAFSRRVQSLKQATTCTCESCSRVPALDLKFVVHAGEVVRHKVAGRAELGGTDAIVAHRLLKASTPEALGLKRYALLTDACMTAVGLEPDGIGARAAIESFEFLGDIPVHILDLGGTRQERPWSPPRARALAEAGVELAAARMTVWQELTAPERRMSWEGELQIAGGPESRMGVGSMTTCVANRLASVEEILAWQPFEAFVRRAAVDGHGRLTAEHRLTSTSEGARTRLQVRWFGPRSAESLALAQRDRLDQLARRLEVADADR